jgi:hypothetical protein
VNKDGSPQIIRFGSWLSVAQTDATAHCDFLEQAILSPQDHGEKKHSRCFGMLGRPVGFKEAGAATL